MKLVSLTAAIALTAIGDVPVMPDTYTLLCEGENAVGFNWRSGAWVRTNFRPERYLVVRSESNDCLGNLDNEGRLFGETRFFTKDVCLNIRKFGADYRPKLSDKCTEFYVLSDDGWSRTFYCDGLFNNMSGNFNGGYRKFVDSSINDELATKDSMLLEVGRCSQIS